MSDSLTSPLARSNPRGPLTTPSLTQRVWHRLGYVARDEARDAGFTLIEVIVSFIIFAVVSGAATTAIVKAIQSSHTSQQRIDAANIAQKYVTFTGDMSAIKAGAQTPFVDSVRNEQFTVKRTITFNGSATSCSPGASFTVHVIVAQKQSNAFLARTDSVVACQASCPDASSRSGRAETPASR